MRRAAIFMADAGRGRVRAVGCPRHLVRAARGAAPDARQHADRAAGAAARTRSWSSPSGSRRRCRPSTREVLGITTLVCTPLSAAGRAYGVICADRGGGRFELSDGERHLLWTLGKTAALVATARNATRQQERSAPPRRAARPGARDPRARAAATVRRLARAERRAARSSRQSASAAGSRCRRRSAICAGRSSGRWRRSRRRPGPRWPSELERLRGSLGAPVEVDWPRRGHGAAGSRAAGPVGAGRGAAQRRQARRAATRVEVAGRARRRHVHARGAQRRRPRRRARGAGWACGWRLSRRSSTAG